MAVGGGPKRVHPRLVNLNLAPFPNVDLVGTALSLPFASASVAAVHCEALLEHLEFPELAVKEMFRVLRPGGQVFAATPFLQSFHGYPGHFQNYTLPGHRRFFERAGFEIVASGLCVGPVRALVDLVAKLFQVIIPGLAGQGLAGCWLLIGVLLRPIDVLLNRVPSAHRVASTTFVHARKPLSAQQEGCPFVSSQTRGLLSLGGALSQEGPPRHPRPATLSLNRTDAQRAHMSDVGTSEP